MRLHFFLSLLAISLLLWGCSPHDSGSRSEPLPPLRVATERVEAARRPHWQPVAGTVRPLARAQVAAKVMGTVVEAEFTVGQAFSEGELVLRLSAEELGARLAQAEAVWTQLRREHQREAGLAEKGASTDEAVRTLADQLRIAEAALTEARTLLGYTRVTAPFAGVVTAKYVYTGDLATPGTPLFAFEGTDRFQVEVAVPESLPFPAIGTSLVANTGTESISGSLAELSPAAAPLSRTRLAKIDLPADAPTHSGQFVRVLWPDGERETLAIPLAALAPFGQMERVFVVRDGHADLRLIKTGSRENGRVQVLSGLERDEVVVLSPPAALRDRQPVEVAP